MQTMKKHLGFRIGENIGWWRDKYGKGGGIVIKFIPLPYLRKVHNPSLNKAKGQVWISNGDILTTEVMLDTVFREKANSQST